MSSSYRSFRFLAVSTALFARCGVALTTVPPSPSRLPKAMSEELVGERFPFQNLSHHAAAAASALVLGCVITAMHPVVADAAVVTTATKHVASDPAIQAIESPTLSTGHRSAARPSRAFQPSPPTINQHWVEGPTAWNSGQSSLYVYEKAPGGFVLPSVSLSATNDSNDDGIHNSESSGGDGGGRRRIIPKSAPSQDPPNPAVVRVVGPVFWSYLGFSTLAGIKGVYDGFQRKRGKE
jgi:hypothetical protein